MIYIYLVLIKLCHHKDRVAVVRNAYHKITLSSRALDTMGKIMQGAYFLVGKLKRIWSLL